MIPITMVETDRDDFEGTVVELWRADSFVGMVFFDGAAPIVQIYPDGDDDVHDLDVRELQVLLDTAVRIVDPAALDEDLADLREAARTAGWEGEHPATAELLSEFDDRAVHRTEDGEGFFERAVADAFIARCEELDLAVVEMEGFDLVDGELGPDTGLELAVTPQSMMTWSEFRTFANATAASKLAEWPMHDSLVVAFVFQQPDAEIIVA
jgi:hypothetical protein